MKSFRVHPSFWSHPKVLGLSDEALALWTRAGSWCCAHRADGHIPAWVLQFLGASEAARELVSAGLWEAAEDGWWFHDWQDYQTPPSRRQHPASAIGEAS